MQPTKTVDTQEGQLEVIDLQGLLGKTFNILPHVLRLLSENHIRNGGDVDALTSALKSWLAGEPSSFEFVFQPNRLLMHDTTCTPALADIAGMRDALAERGSDPSVLSPQLPVEVSVDHSLAVDKYASPDAPIHNLNSEVRRNQERYRFMKWASSNMPSVHVNPPGSGIMHTINLEQLATVLEVGKDRIAHPDMLLGTDSHTPMINGIGVLGWGIGGLEAESIMFGQAVTLVMPRVIGVRLEGTLPATVFSTDLALTVTHQLRKLGVTGDFVEFYGPGVAGLTADDRAVIANMAPEYGATTGFFAVDKQTIDYLNRTGRKRSLTQCIEPVFRSLGLLFDPADVPHFNASLTIDLSTLAPLVSGPRRPQDKHSASDILQATSAVLGREIAAPSTDQKTVPDGAIGIAAITSCTNTSDPRLLIAAGLLARKARSKGLTPPHWVKTSLAPGSPSAENYLKRSGLLDDLTAIGFGIVGFGCTTCIGNPGPLPDVIEQALQDNKAVVAVLSGNRNFPGRVHPKLDLGFLASPPMVVALGLRGVLHGDILNDPLGYDQNGQPVYLNELWPSKAEIEAAFSLGFRPADVTLAFSRSQDSDAWKSLGCIESAQFPWDKHSRNLRRPKFASFDEKCRLGSYQAQPLMVLGDDMTTDHISPAGWIDPESQAGQWLVERGGNPDDLNVYASYRGNWEVMLRGLFTNKLARNYIADDLQPPYTSLRGNKRLPVYQAAELLQKQGISSVLLAGERYGMGSSRDWAAKGVGLLGVRAVIARSFERIHRSNLIGMGVLPIQIMDDFIPASSEVTPEDTVHINMSVGCLEPRMSMEVILVRSKGAQQCISATVAVETQQEIETLKAGGVLPRILRKTLR